MTRSNRFMRQDYTAICKSLDEKDLQQKKEIKENLMGVAFLVFFFLIFGVAGSLTYPY
jgi:hypothetical protein